MSHREFFIAGHGGQGVLELGNLLAYAAMARGERVAYTPSYGPETRGGKVRCYVLTDDRPLDSPIAEVPDVMVVMNEPSMDFVPQIKAGGALIRNASLAVREAERDDIEVFDVPLTDLAAGFNKPEYDELRGNLRDGRVVQNAVAFGAVLAATGTPLDEPAVEAGVRKVFSAKPAAVPLNLKAIEVGHAAAMAVKQGRPAIVPTVA